MNADQGHFVQTISNSVSTVAEVGTALVALARPLGFQAALFSAVRPRDPVGSAPCRYFATKDAAFVRAYFDRRVYEVDPVLNHTRAARTSYALHWDDFGGVPMSPGMEDAYAYLDSHWATSSIGFPGTEPVPGIRWNVAFLGDHTKDELQEIRPVAEDRLAIASAAAVLRLSALDPGGTGQTLTGRERECLTLLAAGERIDRIADRLGIAAVTVSFHIRNTRRKLGARTNAQAIAAAMRGGDLPL